MGMLNILRIGTRGSKLAMLQANMAAAALRAAHPGLHIEIIEILTSGDWRPAQGETRLSEAQGGKGLFAREIEAAILAGRVDCGVHSMKDMASFLPEGLAIDHMLAREDPRDAFLARDSKTLGDLKPGAVVGTSSLRRQAMILARRPDLKIVPLRGNVPTRIEKLKAGNVDATLLALAGLKRLGLEGEAGSILGVDEMLPAAGQGAIGIETRAGDQTTRSLLAPLNDNDTLLRVKAERAALQVLDGSCHTPIGAHAVLSDGDMDLRVMVVSPDGRQVYEDEAKGPVKNAAQAEALGRALGERLKPRIPPGILAK